MEEKDDSIYESYRWFKSLLFFLSGLKKRLETSKNSSQSSLNFFAENKKVGGSFLVLIENIRTNIDIIHKCTGSSNALVDEAIVAAKNKIDELKNELITRGDPRVREDS